MGFERNSGSIAARQRKEKNRLGGAAYALSLIHICSGMREAMGLDDTGEPMADPGYQKRFPEALGRRGFVVIVPELLGFGQRRWVGDESKPLNHSACHQISTALWMYGQTMAGMRAFDVKRLSLIHI